MSLRTVTPVIPATTVQLSNTPITVTSASSSSSSQIPSPTLSARPAGWHAKSFGFDWNKRANQHKYLVKTGLPEVHAAIMNDDWDLALELICPEDFGLNWLPSTSQSPQKNSRMDLEASRWPVTLLSQNQDARKHAIMNMAIQTCNATSIGNKSLYGTNLLTLCLLKPALPEAMQQVITIADKQAPQYLNLPDALGRTPLWVALENQDQASVQLLLKAGANPLQACKFSAEGEAKSPLSLAAKSANKELFRDLLRAIVEQGKKSTPYNFNDDPLFLKRWASVHSSEDVLWLADQVEALRGPLLCCEDILGSSYFYQSVIDGLLDNTLSNGNEDLIEWLRKLDTSPTVSEDIESSPLYAAASQASVHTYKELEKFFLSINKEALCDDDRDDLYSETPETDKLYKKIEEKFLLRWTDKDFDQYLDSLPIALQATKSHQKKTFIQKQYEALVNNQHTLNFDDYSRTIKSVWLHISDEQKNFLLSEAVSATDGRLELLFTMIDFEFNSVSLFALAANYLKSD